MVISLFFFPRKYPTAVALFRTNQVDGAKKATPLLLCLICIELTDFVFAVDSIPAVLGISHDTFIVYASNVSFFSFFFFLVFFPFFLPSTVL